MRDVHNTAKEMRQVLVTIIAHVKLFMIISHEKTIAFHAANVPPNL